MSDLDSLKSWRWNKRRELTGYLNIDLGADTHAITNDLPNIDGKVTKAINRATRKAAQWLVTHSVREMAKELGIKQAPIKERFHVDFTGKEVKIWVGLLEIGAQHIANPQQNAAGVKVGKEQYDGAFYKTIYGSEGRVYIRAKRNRAFKHSVVRQRRRLYPHYDHSFMTENSGRFPVQTIGVAIEEVGIEILGRYESRLNKRYREILAQELNYAFKVEQ
jgi:hypothetical protein